MKLFRNVKTVRREESRKEILYFSLALALFLDLFAAVLLGVSQVTDAKYLACPILLVIVDAGFLLLSVFTNYRFRYSIAGTLIYLCCTLILVAVMTALHANGGTVTLAAGSVWLVSHLLSVAGVVAAAFGIARRSGKLKFISYAAGGAVLIAAVLYGAIAGTGGVFGQGMTGRTVTYAYDKDTDGYVAVSLVAGRGGKLIIPETFNGKRVRAADCGIFSEEGLTEIYLDSAGELELENTVKLQAFREGVVVYADRSEYDALRSGYFKEAYETSSEGLLRFACSFAPTGLAADEVFVSFDYSMDTLQTAKGEVLPVWVGKKGDTFRLDFADIGYARHADEHSDADLLWCSRNMGGFILTAPVAGNTSIAGTSIEHSVTGAQLRFARIFRITIGEDNDAVYETPDDYKFTVTGGETLNYRLATVNTCDEIIDNFPKREGFALSFRTAGSTLSGKLSDVLKSSSSDRVSVFPDWRLLPPSIRSLSTANGGRTITYGNAATILWETETPAEGFACDYEITLPDGSSRSLNGQTDYEILNFQPSDGGTYLVTIGISAPKITSLTAEASSPITLEFAKRELTLAWDDFADDVYDGSAKEITANVLSGVINDDEITFQLSRKAVHDAGSYTVVATLTGNCDAKYALTAPSASRTYTVKPRPVAVDWTVGTYTYNGLMQAPTASITLVNGSARTLSVSGGRGAGEQTATATNSDGNYTLTNPTQRYTIAKRGVSLVWSDTASFTYDGSVQYPVAANVNNAVAGEQAEILRALSYAGGGRTVGSYTVTATLNHANYEIAENASRDFTVTARDYRVRVYSSSKTYDGKKFDSFAVNFSGLAGNDSPVGVAKIEYTYTTDLTSAGEHDIIPVVTTINENYRLASAEKGTIVIAKRPVTIIADSKSKTYDGTAFTDFTYSAVNLAEGESKESVCGSVTFTVSGNATDAGTYTITVDQTNASDNYTFTRRSGTLTIAKRVFSLQWSQKRVFAYGEDASELRAVPDCDVAISYEYYDVHGVRLSGVPTAAGSYTVRVVYDTDNYTALDPSCTFTIEKRAVTISWTGSREFTVGEDAGALKATPSYAVEINYEYYDFAGNRLSGVPTAAGSYTVRAVVKDADGRYTVTGDRCTFVIVERSDISVGDSTGEKEARA